MPRMKIVDYSFIGAVFVVLPISALTWFLLTHQPTEVSPTLTRPLAMQPDTLQAVTPLSPIAGLDPARVALGERLFNDPRLSGDETVSCASCHDLAAGGVDGRRFSTGIGGATGSINAPTVFNSAYNIAQFWDGRAATLEEQALGPLQDPIEMGATWPVVLERLERDAEILARFRRLYPDGLTAANVLNAIATFERSLIPLNSRFDRYLRGEREALTELEQEGYRRFRELGCVSCHQGMLLGGNMYQKFGIFGDYFANVPETHSDLGRYNVTGREEDRHVFKVPSLRNVAMTAPYFHNGSAATLEEAVQLMARLQLGRELSGADVHAVAAFLRTLNGEPPKAGKK